METEAALPEPLARNAGALGLKEQQKLRKSHVIICGCGGLGGQVIESLARIGVGRLTLFDPDRFSPSNLNRQLGALTETLGNNKAEVLADRVGRIHDLCRVKALAMDFRETDRFINADVVVDCLDNDTARRDLATRCLKQSLPLVHGAVNGWYGQIGIQLPGGNLLERLYPKQSRTTEPPPVLSFTPSLVACLQAAETVKLLIGRPSQLINGWLSVDLLHGDFEYL
ncbi:MAG TPA: HesA/MoeB/ThiF family protein [Desulfobulbus sp.]|nr:HesA/MoeB/ThiF family protein [Desulfobulbus sp.]